MSNNFAKDSIAFSYINNEDALVMCFDRSNNKILATIEMLCDVRLHELEKRGNSFDHFDKLYTQYPLWSFKDKDMKGYYFKDIEHLKNIANMFSIELENY